MSRVLAVEENLVVVDFGRRDEPLITKKALARKLGRSERWIEQRVAEGMPASTDKRGRRIFLFANVQTWLDEHGRSVANG